jgi:hypothetical protein
MQRGSGEVETASCLSARLPVLKTGDLGPELFGGGSGVNAPYAEIDFDLVMHRETAAAAE